MIKKHKIIFIISLFFICQISLADIYSYLDEQGRINYVNYPVPGGKLVQRLSPIVEDEEVVENVQNLLDSPRFSRQVTMVADSSGFLGNFPAPRYFMEQGIVAVGPRLTDQVTFKSKDRESFSPYIKLIAKQYNLQPALLHAIIMVESAYNPNAVSHAGAEGLMQLMPVTAKRFGVIDSFDPIQNMQGGAAYLRFLLDKFKDVSLALAGYNAGEGSVMKYNNTIPPYKETMNYVPKVLEHYQRYRAQGY